MFYKKSTLYVLKTITLHFFTTRLAARSNSNLYLIVPSVGPINEKLFFHSASITSDIMVSSLPTMV